MRSIIPILTPGGPDGALWPLARAEKPKAFHALNGPRTLIQDAALRLKALAGQGLPVGPLALVVEAAHADLALDQLESVGAPPALLVLTPAACGPSIAAALACFAADELDSAALALIAPCDQVIADEVAFADAVRRAAAQAEKRIVTFAGANAAPDAGAIAMFRPGVLLDAFTGQARAVRDAASAAWFGARRRNGQVHLDGPSFARAPDLPFSAVFQPGDPRFVAVGEGVAKTDIASWAQVLAIAAKDGDGVARHGRALVKQSRDSLVFAEGLPVTVCGVEGLIVVATPNGVLVVSKDRAHQIDALIGAQHANAAPGAAL